MNVPAAHHGEKLLLVLEPSNGSRLPKKGFSKDTQVHLVFPKNGDTTLLHCGGHSLAVSGKSDVFARRLRKLRDSNPARYCWIAAHDGDSQLTVLVHRFRTKLIWEDDLPVGVDERIVERVEKMAGRRLGVAGVCKWLTERMVTAGLIVATGAPDTGGNFRILGRGFAVDIASHEGALIVDRVVALRSNRGFRPPEFLIEVALRFDDATATGKVRASVRAQLERLVAECDNSYLALWEEYQKIEREQLVRKAHELGWVAYTSYKALPSGLWAFKIEDKTLFSDFRQRLAIGHELETGAKLPAELLHEEPRGAPGRPFMGVFYRAIEHRQELELRSVDDDDLVPPDKGYLYGALQGDRTRLSRREEAVKRMRSADARIPQLALILEGQPAPKRRTDAVKALSAGARQVFKFGETPAQRRAIDQALNTPDIALIQGPPGTGKTTVIAALQVRLAEIEAEDPALGGRSLLTSYQHGAVNNAVERTTVFGLPPARIGGRRRSRAASDQADRWAVKAREKIQDTLDQRIEDRPRADYHRFRDRIALYASGNASGPEARALIEDFLALEAGVLPTTVWNSLLKLQSPPRCEKPELSLKEELTLERVHELPYDAASFQDGGPRKVRRALRQLRSLDPSLEPEQQALLERASKARPDDTFPELEALAALRTSLLARIMPASPNEPSARSVQTKAFNAALAVLYTRMLGAEGSIADALAEYADSLHFTPNEVIQTLRHYSAIYAATCQQSVGYSMGKAKDQPLLSFENVVVDEAARANPLDLLIPMSLGKRRIILVGDHRQLPHLLEPDVERELMQSVSDETAKALKTSLFERLFEDLRAREQRDGIRRVETLDQQFRMHPTLGQFVSDVFYEPHGEGFRSPRPASEFRHNIQAWTRAQPACAAWKNIPFAKGGEQRSEHSWQRQPEATWIAQHVRTLIDDDDARNLTIGVISFYRAQVGCILQAFAAQGLAEHDRDYGVMDIAPPYRTLDRGGKLVERLRVGTVDAFQGMEFDIVLLSVVRSNEVRAEDEASARRKFGHLLLPNRLCVAMSRQQRLLIVVGDNAMFDTTSESTPHVPGLNRFLTLCGGTDGLVI